MDSLLQVMDSPKRWINKFQKVNSEEVPSEDKVNSLLSFQHLGRKNERDIKVMRMNLESMKNNMLTSKNK